MDTCEITYRLLNPTIVKPIDCCLRAVDLKSVNVREPGIYVCRGPAPAKRSRDTWDRARASMLVYVERVCQRWAKVYQ